MPVRALVTGVVTVALVFGSVVSVAHADEEPTVKQPLAAVDGSVDFDVADSAALPLIESEIGRGAPLSTVAGARIDVAAAVGGHRSALVRVAGLSAVTDTTVYSSGGSAVLFVPAGTSASTSVLLPVREGTVELWASAPMETRIEVLAAFTGEENRPGSIVALETPVMRAETTSQLAGSGLSTLPFEVGVIGQGGVPSEGVRAVFATLDLTVSEATDLIIDAQVLPVPAGRSVLTTIVAPDADGTVRVRSASGSGHLRLDIRGWVAEAPFYAEQANLPGSFVPVTEAATSQRVPIQARAEGPSHGSVIVGEVQDTEWSLGLLSATSSTETTLLHLGASYEGRARGLVVDGNRGAAPQLVMTRSLQEFGTLTLRRGAAAVSWVPVGDIVSVERQRVPGEADPTIVIESLGDGSEQDLGDHGYFTLSGSASTPGSSVDRIEVLGPEGVIGTARLRFDEAGLGWEFDAAAPIDGVHTYTVTIHDRSGRSASDELEVEIVAVDEEDVVTAPNAFLFNSPDDMENQGTLTILEEDDAGVPTTVSVDRLPGFAPGDTLVAAVTPATPSGVFVTVRSIDRVGDRWIVWTAAASIGDVFFQADVDETVMLDDPAQMAVDTDLSRIPTPGGEYEGDPLQTDVEYVHGDGDRAWVETENVDLADLTEDWSEGNIDPGGPDEHLAEDIIPAAGRAVPVADPQPFFTSSLSMSLNLLATWSSSSSTAPSLKEMSEQIKDPDAREQALTSAYEQIKSENKLVVALGARLQAGVELTAVLDTSIDWKWGFIPVGITINELSVKAVITIKIGASLKATLASEVGGTWWNPLGGFRLPTFTVPVGPIPLIFTNDIDFAIKAKIGLELSLELPDISYKSVLTYGFTYSDAGGYQTLSKPAKHSGSLGPFESWDGTKISGKLGISLGPEAQLSTKIYSVAGPNMTLSSMLKFTGEVGATYKDQDQSWHPYASYKVALAVELKGGVKIVIWKKELGKWDFFTFTAEVPIFQGRTPAPAPPVTTNAWIFGTGPPVRSKYLLEA